ncbi:probable receptor-like protein kinase At5g59700 [Lactuca sativa]|uniref:Protein kinase domain-containing protein n=1 Tax=Lactuca sativa TaxID=4236 RepID=A0A9R1XWK6_LACSA|nr:probable receptor-like protein kinase At5g59700 [Lactuca sativa]KAJ0224779.1 hypothetical protein LSAT_V11C100041630 [Lactuca sativa]
MSSSKGNLENYLIPLEEINLATKNFSLERFIGGGGFGKVYVGELSERWQNRTAAIKRRAPDSYQGEDEFRNELHMILKFKHENIISFIGYCDEADEMIIVYEYATNGSLDHHLQYANKMCDIAWTQRLKICLGAAKGLDYLHSGLGEHTRVIHRDFKSANILLDENLVAKICDFGLSKWGPKNRPITHLNTKVAGTQFYLDPAYHESHILRKESDVYSFGVVLFEMLSGMLVYSERSLGNKAAFLMTLVRQSDEKKVHELVDPHIRHQISSPSFFIIKEVAYQCISLNLKERPSMAIVIGKIEHALDIQGLPGSDVLTITDMCVGDFLILHPSKLKFPLELKKHSLCSLHLTNKTDQFIAFKIQTTTPLECNVRPNNGIILPRSVCNITVIKRAVKEAPPGMMCKSKFKVKAVVAPNGATTNNITNRMFDKEENKVVEEFTLRAIYIHVS